MMQQPNPAASIMTQQQNMDLRQASQIFDSMKLDVISKSP